MKYFIIILAVITISGCDKLNLKCDQNHPEVERINNISQQRLTKLFEQVKSLQLHEDGFPFRYRKDSEKHPIPSEFDDLKLKSIFSLYDNVVRLDRATCLHASVGIEVYNNSKEKNIKLIWTEGDDKSKKRLLWEKND